MATELLQDLEGLSVSADVDHAYLQAGVTSFDEVEEIVKSNLRMISELTHDENAQDGFPEGYDLLGILNLQSSDLDEKDTADSIAQEKIVSKNGGENAGYSNLEITADGSEMLQASKDLLDDITLVINSDKNFTNNHLLLTAEKEGLEGDRKEMPGLVKAGKLDVALRLLVKESTSASTKTPVNGECPLEDVDNANRDLKLRNSKPRGAWPEKGVYFEQCLNDLLDGDTSEVLTTPQEQNVYHEYLLEDSKSLDSMPESLLVERSAAMLPDQLFRDLSGTAKVAAKSRLANQAHDDHDVTVDGEGGDNTDGSSLDLCQLTYDENLTCSFFELLQLHNDDNSELIEHGQRGRPPRQKVTRQAVPCKIEPKVSQAGLQPSFFPPQLFSSTFRNIQPELTSAVPSQLQPRLGQEVMRFPVVLQSKTSASGQLYLEVCPDVTQIASSSQASARSSTSPPQGRSSPKGNSEKSCVSSHIEVTSAQPNLAASTDRSSHLPGDGPKVSQNNFSLEIDGPIRRQTSLSQVRNGSSRNDPYLRMIMENSGQAVGSPLEEAYRMQTVQENQISTMSSHNFLPSSSVSSSQNLMRAENVSGFGGNMQHGMPYISTSMEGSLYQNNQRFPVPNTFINYGMHDQPSQYILPTNNHHYELGSNTSSTNSHSRYFGNGVSGEPMGNWTSEPNINMAASSANHCLQNNNPVRHTVTSAAVPYARTGSPGMPNIPVDPLSRRVRMLMAMGSHGQRQMNNDSSSEVYSTTTPQNVVRLPALNNEHNSSMIQLSPPAELRMQQFVHQQPVNVPPAAHVPSSGATADGSVMDKSVLHAKSSPSQSSTRSSKGPELPVPVERSKARVEKWLNNNVMFRPDLDSGTFDPSDHSLVHEPSVPHMAHQYVEAAGSGQALSEQSYEFVGLFEGKRMMVVPPQPSSKQKPGKRTSALNHHGRGSPLAQIGQTRHSIISDASVITESSLSSGHTNSSKGKHADSKHDAFNDSQEKPAGRKPAGLHTDTPMSTSAAFNPKNPITRQSPQQELPMPTQSLSGCPVGQLDENQQADWAIAEGMKFLEQTSFEKRLAGISSTSSGHVLSELEQYLRCEMKSSSGGTSGNHPGSGFKMEGVASGTSKQSSFDTSKYITPSYIESLEKKTQNGKSSIDNYLDHVKYISNESMHAEQKTSPPSDGKQLTNIPLNDIAEVIGFQGEVSQQPSRLGSCLPPPQFDNRQKALKRRPADHSDETTYQTGQAVAAAGQNAGMGEQNVAFGGPEVVLGGQHVVLGEQNVAMGRQSGPVGEQNATVCGQDTAVCGQNATVGRNNITYAMQTNKIPQVPASVHGMTQAGQPISANYLASKTQNYGDQHFIVFAEQGGIPQTVIGPPTTQPDYFANSGLPQYAKSCSSSTALSGPTQSKPVYESQSFQAIPADQVASQTLLSGKMQSGFQLPDFSDSCYETEMISSPSSMEILKESSPMSNHEFFNLADATGNPSVPVASVSCTQHVMQSGANKIAPAVALFTQSPSLSSSTHSTVTSASHVGNTIFKKPQVPCGSSGSPAAVYRGGTPNYPSVGGDSDVSMSSDTSLPNSMTLHDVSMDPKMQIHQRQTSPLHQQQTSPQQHFEQNSVQFQQINPQQLVPKMSQSTQQPVQHHKQQQLLSQQHKNLQMQQNQHQQQHLLLQQQKHQQIEQSQLQQMMASQQQCQQMQNQQINNQDYYQMQKKQQEMLNQQNLQFRTKQQMSSQQQQQQEQHQLHQEIQHNDQHGDDNQQKQLQHLCHQQQFEELLLQQQQPNQQEQFYLMQVQKQQEIQQQRQHLQQQIQHLQQQIQQQEQNSQQQIQQQEQHSQQQVQQQGHLQQQFQQPGHLQQQIQQPGHLQQQIQQPGHLQQQIQQPGHLQQQIQQPGHLQQQIQQPGQLQQQIQQQGQLQQQIQQPGQLQQQIQQPGHLQQQIQQQGQHLQQQIQKPKQHPQQQIPQLGQHLQQQTANKQHLQTQNQQQQQHLHLQSQQQLHTQQSPKQPAEISQSHPLQNQQQMQQYQWLLNRQRYQQMQLLQQQQIQQQQKQMENQQLQQQPRLYQQQQEQHSEHCPTLNSTCIPRRAPSSQAGSSHSEPQPSRTLPSAKIVKRSMSQISDYIYSQQLASLSPASETTHDLQASIADNDLACVPQDCLQLTGSSIQSGHGNNVFNNLDKNSMSGQNQQPGLQNFIQPPFGNQPLGNTAAGNTEIAAHDQILKSATEIQLQKYLKEGFPSLNSVEYCPQALGVSSFSPANSPPRNKPQQSVANTGQGLDSGGGSSDQSNRVHQAERSREEADSDLSAFSLGSGEDLLSFQQDNDGETPLHLLSELPKEGISSLPSMPGFYEALNLQNKNQETALDIAVKNENLDAVKFLVSHGADVNIFCLSSQKGSGSKTVHRNETVQQTALHEAVELGNTQILKVLLSSQNVKVDARRPDSGLTPLMLALQLHRQADRQEIISELINHQASLNLHDTIQGKTPLMFAIQSRDVSLVERILQQVGAEKARVLVSDRAKKEMTCLHFAAELRLESLLKKRLLRCIIVAGGDPSAKNSEGETPRDWAKADINEVLQNLARLFNP